MGRNSRSVRPTLRESLPGHCVVPGFTFASSARIFARMLPRSAVIFAAQPRRHRSGMLRLLFGWRDPSRDQLRQVFDREFGCDTKMYHGGARRRGRLGEPVLPRKAARRAAPFKAVSRPPHSMSAPQSQTPRYRPNDLSFCPRDVQAPSMSRWRRFAGAMQRI